MSDVVDGRTLRARAQRATRRKQILERALAVFAERGYHQTSISDLVSAAGVARGTFYLYFESKRAIFLELVDQLLEQVSASVIGVDESAGAPPIQDQLLDRVARIVGTITANRALTRMLFREAVGLDEVIDAKLNQFYAALHAYLAMALRGGQRVGHVRDDIDLNITATCILGSIKQVADQYLLTDNHVGLDVDRMARGILEHNMRGVARVL